MIFFNNGSPFLSLETPRNRNQLSIPVWEFCLMLRFPNLKIAGHSPNIYGPQIIFAKCIDLYTLAKIYKNNFDRKKPWFWRLINQIIEQVLWIIFSFILLSSVYWKLLKLVEEVSFKKLISPSESHSKCLFSNFYRQDIVITWRCITID